MSEVKRRQKEEEGERQVKGSSVRKLRSLESKLIVWNED